MTRASDLAKLLGAGATILDGTTISTADNTAQLTLISTDADANSAPLFLLDRNSASPADGDRIGEIVLRGRNDAGQSVDCIMFDSFITDASDGSEDSELDIRTMVGGSEATRILLDPAETVFNEASIDLDFRVESNGNANMLFVDGGNDRVGIGTSSPNTTLTTNSASEAVGISAQSTTTGSFIGFKDATSTNWYYNHVGAVGDNLKFTTGGAERMRILSGGQLVINATSLPVVGTEKLGVSGGSASNSVAIAGTCSHNTGIPLYLSNISNTTNTYIARFATGSGGSTRGEIYFNGSALVYATSSDYRLKQNINYDFDATTKLKQLKPAEYRWIEHQKDDIGFLAHEVQEVFPNAVGGEKDEVNADGSIKPQTYDPSKLVPLLVKTIQELEARITALEGE